MRRKYLKDWGSSRQIWGFVILLSVLLSPMLAFAHAKLLRSAPADGARLREPPKLVELWFSEGLEVQFSSIVVTDGAGTRVDKNNAQVTDDGKKLQVELQDLAAGSYTVDWKALSTDQHMMKGKFTFTVEASREASGRSANSSSSSQPEMGKQPHSMPDRMEGSSIQGPVSSWSMEAARWFEYLAMMMLFGGIVFHLFVLKPALNRASGLSQEEKSGLLVRSARLVTLFSWLAIAVLSLTAAASLVLQTATVNEKSITEALRPSLLYQVIAQSGFGAAWRLEVWALAALVLILLLARGSGERGVHPAAWWAALLASALLFITPTWTGHAAAAVKEYPFATLSDWLHLISGAFWVGGLFHLALTLPRSVSALGKRQRFGVIYRLIHVFTSLALVSIFVLILTGLYNSWIHVESLSALWNTAYGKTLLLKVLLALPMLALGAINTFVIHPRLARALEREEGEVKDANLDRTFYRSVSVEAALGASMLLVAAILVYLQPAREHPMMMGTNKRSAVYSIQGD